MNSTLRLLRIQQLQASIFRRSRWLSTWRRVGAVVASRIGQIEQMIEHGSTGLLVPPGDAGAFADAFERLARDPLLRSRLGDAARASISRTHSWNRIAERVLNLAGCVTAEV